MIVAAEGVTLEAEAQLAALCLKEDDLLLRRLWVFHKRHDDAVHFRRTGVGSAHNLHSHVAALHEVWFNHQGLHGLVDARRDGQRQVSRLEIRLYRVERQAVDLVCADLVNPELVRVVECQVERGRAARSTRHADWVGWDLGVLARVADRDAGNAARAVNGGHRQLRINLAEATHNVEGVAYGVAGSCRVDGDANCLSLLRLNARQERLAEHGREEARAASAVWQLGVVPRILAHVVDDGVVRLDAVAEREAPPYLAEARNLICEHLLALRVVQVVEEEVEVQVVLDFAHDAVERQEAVSTDPVEDAVILDDAVGRQD